MTMVLREGLSDLEVLLIERSHRADDPASGQVALPGGHVDPADVDLRATALRELDEEVGLGASDLAGLPRYVSTLEAPRFALHVGLFAAALGPGRGSPGPRSPREVRDVFWLPLGELASLRTVTWEGPGGPRQVEAAVHGAHVVWGFTLRALRHALFEGRAESGGEAGRPPQGGGAGLRGSQDEPIHPS